MEHIISKCTNCDTTWESIKIEMCVTTGKFEYKKLAFGQSTVSKVFEKACLNVIIEDDRIDDLQLSEDVIPLEDRFTMRERILLL